MAAKDPVRSYVLLGIDCSIRLYQLFVAISLMAKIFPIILALCLMLLVTYYSQINYAGIISWSLYCSCTEVTEHNCKIIKCPYCMYI